MEVVSGSIERADQAERFERLIQPLLASALGLALSMLGDRQAAEDAVQEAATKACLLFLRYHLDMPPSEIARVLRWRVGTVKSRLHRTLRRLEAEAR